MTFRSNAYYRDGYACVDIPVSSKQDSSGRRLIFMYLMGNCSTTSVYPSVYGWNPKLRASINLVYSGIYND